MRYCERIAAAQSAVNRFLYDLLGEQDEVFLYRFDSRPQLVHGWTEDRRGVGRALGSISAGGGTAMEAYYVLDRYLASHPPPKIVLLSLAPYHFQESLFWERLTRYHFLRFREQRGGPFITTTTDAQMREHDERRPERISSGAPGLHHGFGVIARCSPLALLEFPARAGGAFRRYAR